MSEWEKFLGTACGSDCMRDNGCHGYEVCAGCGQRFCRFDLDDRDLCPRCAERRDEREDEADEADEEGGGR